MGKKIEQRSHAHLNTNVRLRKAEKILRLIEARRPLDSLHTLEVGCGSGVISTFLAKRLGDAGRLMAVDVVDERLQTDGYDFIQVSGVELPFPNQSFDLIITNHVIEHVGDRAEQALHLKELARLLRPNGVGYLAVPNRWAVLEPHFRLPFLSWLPRFLRDTYVRWSGKGTRYDCDPPGPLEIRRLIRDANLAGEDITVVALEIVAQLEPGRLYELLTNQVPKPLLRLLVPLYPTMIFLLSPIVEKKHNEHSKISRADPAAKR